MVDTSVWSRVWRRPAERGAVSLAALTLAKLVRDGVPLGVPGIVLQELLSGVRTEHQLEQLAREMEVYPLLLPTRDHHLLAARIMTACRVRGVATTATDALIAATAKLSLGPILTFDTDFERIAECFPIEVKLLREGH